MTVYVDLNAWDKNKRKYKKKNTYIQKMEWVSCSFFAANDVDGGSPEILADADVDARLVEDFSSWILGDTWRYLEEAIGHGQAPGGSQGVGRPGCQGVRVSVSW